MKNNFYVTRLATNTLLRCALLCCLFFPTTVVAQEEEEGEEIVSDELALDDMMGASLEELLSTPMEVWSATKTEETVDTAPSVVQVVTARDIAMWGHQNVADVLHHMLGFYVIDDHMLPNVSVRGISGGLGAQSSIIKVLVNGRVTAFRATAGNWLGSELIPLSAIDRIEVIRGPASALYGADAFLATVNIVLKKPEDLQGGVARGLLWTEEISLKNSNEFLDLDRSFDFIVGVSKNGWGLLLSAAQEAGNRDGLRLPSSSPAPVIPDYSSGKKRADSVTHNSRVWYAELSKESDKGSIKLSGYVSSIERLGEFSYWTQLSSGLDAMGRNNGTVIHLGHAMIGLDATLKATENLSLNLNLSFFTGKDGPNDRIEVASDLYYVDRTVGYKGFSSVAEVHWNATHWLTVIAGSELIFDREKLPALKRIDKSTGDVITEFTSTEDTKDFINPAAYLQAHLTAVPDFLKLTSGIRYDYHNIYGGQITGRAGTVFLWNEHFTTKLLYGGAFKAPTPTLLYAAPVQPGDIVGNENLKPQYIHTFELVPSIRPSQNISLYTAFAYNIILDKAEFVPQDINISAENVSKAEGLSLEMGVNMAYKDILSSYFALEFQRVVREIDGEGYRANLVGTQNIISPPWIFRAGASTSLPFVKVVPLRLSSRVMLVGNRNSSGENTIENGERYNLPAYALWDASLIFEELNLLPQMPTTITLRAYNLLNTNGPDPGFAGVDYPLMPRRYMFELTQKF